MKTTSRSRSSALLALAFAACTSTTPVSPPASPPVVPSVSPPAPVPEFSAARALALVRRLVALGPREATSGTYVRAAGMVSDAFDALGYRVRRQTVRVPAGRNDGIRVDAGTTYNVIAEPPGFDARRPHLLVGGHLDTVPDSAGANDNASGIGVMLELARMASVAPPPLPVVFVAFGAEERRRQSRSASVYSAGSRAYVRALSSSELRALRGALILDMVGAGDRVEVLGTSGGLVATILAEARRLSIPARSRLTRLYSDDVSFAEADVPVAWFWAGDHPTLHTPRDVVAIVQRAQLDRVGRLAWATLRAVESF